MTLLTRNRKMKASSDGQYVVYNWTLPAYRSATGLMTCPAAGTCATGCYAQQGAYVWPAVRAAHERNLELTRDPIRFAGDMHLELLRLKRNLRGRTLVVRVHDSGDFYSAKYLKAWWQVAAAHPDVVFYAYTKQVKLVRAVPPPANFRVLLSEGGLFDSLIDTERDFHSRVFPDRESLELSGYADASENDLVAALGTNHRVGLVYHGAKSKAWRTA